MKSELIAQFLPWIGVCKIYVKPRKSCDCDCFHSLSNLASWPSTGQVSVSTPVQPSRSEIMYER